MPPRLFHSMPLLVAVLAASSCLGQEPVSAVVFASSDKQVVLPRGMMVTLKTVEAGPQQALKLPAGLFLETTLDQKLNGKTCKIGEPVHLTLVYAVNFEQEGRSVRIPERAAITGHVVMVAARAKDGDKAQLAFVTDSISWHGGRAMVRGVAVAAKDEPAETAQKRGQPDLVRPAQESGGAAHPGRSRARDSSGGQPAPGYNGGR